MPLLVRRINRAKWDQIVGAPVSINGISKVCNWIKNLFVKETDVSADAITNCLKTFNNDLSVWHIETDADLEKAILALITGSSQTKLSTLHVVVIEEETALKKGIQLANTPGDTVAKELISNHKDLTNLTYTKLGIVKDLIVDCIKTNKTTLYTRKQLKDIIKKAIKDGKVNKLDLHQDLVATEKL
ncbi:MAG TPA: hypothetical protein PKW69_04025 [Niabella sp.]|nr:hypothetical protein [Niabella sp.]